MLFKDIVGQEKLKKHLVQTVTENRVSHAQLFLGPEGCGKLALAIAYAQYINCRDKQPEDSCGVCPSCLKFNKLIHPDLHFSYPISSTKDRPSSKSYINEWRSLLLENDYYVSLEQWYEAISMENKQGIINALECNEIIKTLGLKAYESEYKVIIIWMVDKLYYSAAPKLLKIIEEPPDKTLFILISENHEQILNTISSRAQLIKVPKISEKSLFNALIEKYQVAPAVAKKVVSHSNGNLIEALNIIEDTDEGDQIQQFREWMLMCHKMELQKLVPWIDGMSKIGRERIKRFLHFGIQVFRSCILINYGSDHLLKMDEENRDFMIKFSKFLNASNTSTIIDIFNKAYFHVERNGNAKVIFMDISIKMNKLINPS